MAEARWESRVVREGQSSSLAPPAGAEFWVRVLLGVGEVVGVTHDVSGPALPKDPQTHPADLSRVLHLNWEIEECPLYDVLSTIERD